MTQFRKRACIATERLSKVTLKAMVTGGTADFFESLSDDQWDIQSFNAMNRNVCVVLYSATTLLARSLTEQIESETDPETLVALQSRLDDLGNYELTNKTLNVTLPEITFNPS